MNGMYQQNPYLAALQQQAMGSPVSQQPMFQMPNLGLPMGQASPVLPTVNGVPVEDLTSKLDRSLGTTAPETKTAADEFSSIMKAGTGGIMSQPMPAAPQGLLRAAAPQQAPMAPQMPQAPQMSPYMQTLQNMIMGRYG
jgi:hypothetical protein